jgi:preprotein translocase subunit SecE
MALGRRPPVTWVEMARTSPFQFFQEVRAEAGKVTWPTRRETLVTTAMVFVFVILATLFFFVVDLVLRVGVGYLLGLGT